MQTPPTEPPLLCVVDDDVGTARLEQRELERRGYRVVVCNSSTAALSLAEERRVDCWLMDQRLAGDSTGLDVVAELRARGVQAPFVLVTGADDPEVMLLAIRAGVRDFVRKGEGFLEMLVSRVETVLKTARAEQQLKLTEARAETEAERRRELEREIAERRRAEERARAALDKLREVDRRKDEFLAMLGHELRNPLAPISNAVEVLRTEPDPERVRWASEIIGRQVDQMRHLVDDLLDVARIMNARLTLRELPVDLRDVVSQAVERIMPTIERRRQSLRVEVADEELFVTGDEVRLVQVVANLLDNAAKYTHEEGAIEVHLERDGDAAEVRVRDNGGGLEPEKAESLFDLFVQGERSPERAEGGLGLGLTLVRRLTTLHGGSVSAESGGPGRGSTFTVRLPLSDDRPAPATDVTAGGDATSNDDRVVLIVDDNVDAARSAEMLLALWGFRTCLAHDGDQALDVIRSDDPDVVLLDIGLPKRDGYEVIRAAREQAGARPRLWVAVTGYGQDSDRQRAVEAGFDVHLTKPVQPDSLRAALATPR